MNRWPFLLPLLSALPLLSQQPANSPTQLTIYNKDFAVARTIVPLDLHPGLNEVLTTNVTSQLEPDSVVLHDPTGRNAVQIAARRPEPLDFPEMARRLGSLGEVRHNAFMLRFATEGHEFTVFPDGRAIIKGTNDLRKARSLYAQLVGS